MRSYNIMEFEDVSFQVEITDPFVIDGHYDVDAVEKVEKWCDENCEKDYLFLLNHALFQTEKDAVIFRLKFGV